MYGSGAFFTFPLSLLAMFYIYQLQCLRTFMTNSEFMYELRPSDPTTSKEGE